MGVENEMEFSRMHNTAVSIQSSRLGLVEGNCTNWVGLRGSKTLQTDDNGSLWTLLKVHLSHTNQIRIYEKLLKTSSEHKKRTLHDSLQHVMGVFGYASSSTLHPRQLVGCSSELSSFEACEPVLSSEQVASSGSE